MFVMTKAIQRRGQKDREFSLFTKVTNGDVLVSFVPKTLYEPLGYDNLVSAEKADGSRFFYAGGCLYRNAADADGVVEDTDISNLVNLCSGKIPKYTTYSELTHTYFIN